MPTRRLSPAGSTRMSSVRASWRATSSWTEAELVPRNRETGDAVVGTNKNSPRGTTPPRCSFLILVFESTSLMTTFPAFTSEIVDEADPVARGQAVVIHVHLGQRDPAARLPNQVPGPMAGRGPPLAPKSPWRPSWVDQVLVERLLRRWMADASPMWGGLHRDKDLTLIQGPEKQPREMKQGRSSVSDARWARSEGGRGARLDTPTGYRQALPAQGRRRPPGRCTPRHRRAAEVALGPSAG